MTVTSTPLCTVEYCPAPSDPDWHHCLVTGSNAIEHHHVEGRGKKRTMDKKKVVPLATPIHKKISLNEYGDAIHDLDGSKVYRIFGLHNETIHEGVHWWMQDDPVLSAAAEGEQSAESVIAPSAAAPSAGLTHEQRVAIAQEIKDAQQRRQFLAGDTANQWEEELNEEFWNLYANEFGYTYPSLRNVMRVCKKIPPNQRHDEMSFAHQELLKNTDIETRDAWLERAHDEDWPVKRLREELVAEELLTAKPKVKRWSRPELQERWDGFWAVREQENPEWDFGTFRHVAFAKFLDWLSAEEQR